jgi:UDP-N-acetylglucosamine 2-epimerase
MGIKKSDMERKIMQRIYVGTFSRASNGALSKLITRLKEEDMYEYNSEKATHIMIPGDRSESFDFALKYFRKNIPIIHLWAGEQDNFATHDDVYRTSITLMSMLQLCTNETAEIRVGLICDSVKKTPNVFTVGNLMLDNIEIDESQVPDYKYDLILYNPITTYSETEVECEISQILENMRHDPIWIEPNGDKFSNLVKPHVTHKTFPRSQFFGLLKNCELFITNSSCQYYEAPFVMKKGKIIPIGLRNNERESKYSDMSIPNATENIISILKGELI